MPRSRDTASPSLEASSMRPMGSVRMRVSRPKMPLDGMAAPERAEPAAAGAAGARVDKAASWRVFSKIPSGKGGREVEDGLGKSRAGTRGHPLGGHEGGATNLIGRTPYF